jgi:hypothetical protein
MGACATKTKRAAKFELLGVTHMKLPALTFADGSRYGQESFLDEL